MSRHHDGERKRWRKAVLASDEQCVRCGSVRKLQAHHLLPWATHPERRFSVGNGATLCNLCHKLTHMNGGVIPSLAWEGRPLKSQPFAALITRPAVEVE